MSIAAAQYSKFKQQVIAGQQVWTFTEEGDYLVIPVNEGEAIPFWSSKSRLMKICSYHAKYSRYEKASLTFAEFLKMLERLNAEKISIGVNWSGKRIAMPSRRMPVKPAKPANLTLPTRFLWPASWPNCISIYPRCWRLCCMM